MQRCGFTKASNVGNAFSVAVPLDSICALGGVSCVLLHFMCALLWMLICSMSSDVELVV